MKKIISMLVLFLLVWEAPVLFAGQMMDVKTGIVKDVYHEKGSNMAMVEHNGNVYKIVLVSANISRNALINAPINFIFIGDDIIYSANPNKPAGRQVERMM